jgi:uncharacterized protein YdeI (YjbR/CyaY-like superfamily)
MSPTNPKVDGYIRKSKEWKAELEALRAIILGCDLTEEVKWRVPCYTTEGKLVLFLGQFKRSCVVSFAKGSLMADPKKILIQQTENSQSVRILQFTSAEQIAKSKSVLIAYINEAIANERAGLKVVRKTTAEFHMPEEFRAKLDALPKLKAAFDALTPGRQRGYLLHFAGAKQSKTRAARVEKWMPQILDGKGLDDE